MDCPNCGVYNPEDRMVCWRCDRQLPKSEPAKKKRGDPSQSTRRMWIIIIVVLLIWAVVSVVLPMILSSGLFPL